MSIAYVQDCLPILNLLAKRINPQCRTWREYIGPGYFCTVCHICNKIEDTQPFELVYDHAIRHLKEYNLLPFI